MTNTKKVIKSVAVFLIFAFICTQSGIGYALRQSNTGEQPGSDTAKAIGNALGGTNPVKAKDADVRNLNSVTGNALGDVLLIGVKENSEFYGLVAGYVSNVRHIKVLPLDVTEASLDLHRNWDTYEAVIILTDQNGVRKTNNIIGLVNSGRTGLPIPIVVFGDGTFDTRKNFIHNKDILGYEADPATEQTSGKFNQLLRRLTDEAAKRRQAAKAKGTGETAVANNAGNFIIVPTEEASGVINIFNQFNTGFEANLTNCEVARNTTGRINKNYIITDTTTGKRYIFQNLGDFFDPVAIEYQLVSLELAQEAAMKAGEFNPGGKFEHWTPIKYYDLKGHEDTRTKHMYERDTQGDIVRVSRVMEFIEDTKFYENFDEVPQQYQDETAGMVAQGIKLFDELLTYVPKDRVEAGVKPLPFYHDTVAHVKEVRSLLAGHKSNVLPSRTDKMRQAQMIPGLLSSDTYKPYRERIQRLIDVFNALSSDGKGEIGFLAYDYNGGTNDNSIQAELLGNRLAHNDTKLNNIGIKLGPDGKPIFVTCIIDLDTIQLAGMWGIDIADAMQFVINPAGEEPWLTGQSIDDVKVERSIFENFVNGYLEGYDEPTKKALRPHVIWATSKIAFELATRFFKAYISELAEVSDAAAKKRCGVYFELPADTPRDSAGNPILRDVDKNLRLAEVRYKVAIGILRTYADELGIDAATLAKIQDPIGWTIQASAAGQIESVLLVEDEPALMEMYKGIIEHWASLQGRKILIVPVSTYEAAEAIWKSAPCDAVVTDNDLHGHTGTGLQLINNVINPSGRTTTTPTFFMSGNLFPDSALETQARTMQTGGQLTLFAAKPFGIPKFLEAMDALQDQKHREAAATVTPVTQQALVKEYSTQDIILVRSAIVNSPVEEGGVLEIRNDKLVVNIDALATALKGSVSMADVLDILTKELGYRQDFESISGGHFFILGESESAHAIRVLLDFMHTFDASKFNTASVDLAQAEDGIRSYIFSPKMATQTGLPILASRIEGLQYVIIVDDDAQRVKFVQAGIPEANIVTNSPKDSFSVSNAINDAVTRLAQLYPMSNLIAETAVEATTEKPAYSIKAVRIRYCFVEGEDDLHLVNLRHGNIGTYTVDLRERQFSKVELAALGKNIIKILSSMGVTGLGELDDIAQKTYEKAKALANSSGISV